MTARRHILPVFGVLVTVAVLIGSAASVAAWRERWYPAPSAIDSTLDIQSGATLQQLTKGYNALAADLYWIRTIQYYGGGAPPFPLLYPLLDLTTTLDPSFNIAYRFGAIFLAEAPPRGPGRPDQAIRLLEKALRAHPGRWEYMQDIGFVHYWWTHDDDAAADWFDRAAHVPGAPWFLQTLAATTRAKGGDLGTARTMWRTIHDTADNDWLRRQAERSLMQIDAMEFMADLQARVDKWRLRADAAPAQWTGLIEARVVSGLPIDPAGVPYEIDPAGKVTVSAGSPLSPLPEPSSRPEAR